MATNSLMALQGGHTTVHVHTQHRQCGLSRSSNILLIGQKITNILTHQTHHYNKYYDVPGNAFSKQHCCQCRESHNVLQDHNIHSLAHNVDPTPCACQRSIHGACHCVSRTRQMHGMQLSW